MADKKFTILDLIDLNLPGHDALDLTCIAGRRGLPRSITVPDINRPGLALSGFFDAFAHDRVQLFGRGETAYLNKLHDENRTDTLQQLFSYKIPCCIFSSSRQPTQEFYEYAEEACCRFFLLRWTVLTFQNVLSEFLQIHSRRQKPFMVYLLKFTV